MIGRGRKKLEAGETEGPGAGDENMCRGGKVVLENNMPLRQAE